MYDNVLADIEGLFTTSYWTTQNISMFPANYMGKKGKLTEYGQVSVMPSSSDTIGHAVVKRLTGLVAIKLFVKAGEGQKRIMQMADILDTLMEHKHLTNGTELGASYLNLEGLDPANSSLYSASYIIPFTKYGD